MVVARERRSGGDTERTGDRTDTVSFLSRPIRWRGDIEGLRAVAVLLVLADHAGLPISGGFVGVDVFFVISGFLITSLLLSELVTTRRISLRDFYARRARRLLPGAAAALAVTGLLTLLLVPRTRWLDIGYDILASALYVQNWRLAGLSVDYQAQDAAVSPLQHFWSLAVEEQFYLLWPLLLLAVAALIRSGRLARRPRGPLTNADPGTRRMTVVLAAAAMALVAVPSFAWSVWYTGANQAGAYFVTTTRLWELAVGGAVALAVGRLSTLSRATAAALTWAGLLTIGVSAAFYAASTPFPGVAALAPVLGAAAVLAGGQAAAGRGAGLLLDTPSMRWVGKLSYSLYLWHWPLLVVAFTVTGQRSLPLGVAVVAASFVPAYLCFRYVENPVRRVAALRRDPGRSLALGGACTATATAVAFAVIATMWPPPSPASSVPVTVDLSSTQAANMPKRGAMVLADNPRDDAAGAPVETVPSITPDPRAAKTDTGGNFCSASLLEVEVESCSSGDSFSPIDVALIGDSHAQQWTAPLSAVATERRWKLTAYTKSGCPFLLQDIAIATDPQGARAATRPYTECAVWRDELLERLTGDNPPDMIIVSGGEHAAVVDGNPVRGRQSTDLQTRGHQEIFQRVAAKGTKVVAIADTPAPDRSVPDCVAENRESLTQCTFSRAESNRADGAALVDAAKATPGVTLIDLSDALCPTDRCAPVIGGVLVWRDISHMSATYASTLAPRLNTLLPPLP